MSIAPTERRVNLSDAVAEEIRAVMGRRRVSGAELARRLKVSPMWVSYRLNGRQEIGLNDMALIAAALGVEVAALLPGPARETTVRTLTPPDRPRDNRPAGRPGPSANTQGIRRPRRIADPTPATSLQLAA